MGRGKERKKELLAGRVIILVLYALTLSLSAGCSQNVTAMFQADQPSDGPDPVPPVIGINVLVKPVQPWPLHEKKALLIPLQMTDAREDRWEAALTAITHSVLLQERLFAVIERYDKDTVPVSRILEEAKERGFDYIITGIVPDILVPSGNTAGWVGLNLKIRGTGDGNNYTLWNLYGGADLKPEPTRHDLMGTSTAVNAPSVTSGFFALVKSMARVIKSN